MLFTNLILKFLIGVCRNTIREKNLNVMLFFFIDVKVAFTPS